MKAQVEQIITQQQQSFQVRRFEQKVFDHPFHYHPEYELTYIVSSTGTRVIGDHVGSFGPGDLCLIGSQLPHIYRNSVEPEAGAVSEVLHFSRDCANGFLDGAPELAAFSQLLDESSQGIHFDVATAEQVVPLLSELRSIQGLRRWSLLLEVVELLLAASHTQQLASVGYAGTVDWSASDRMRNVCQHILEHFDEELSHESFAQELGVTPEHFSRLFKKTTRKTYREFVLEVRLGHACRLLLETDWPIVDIAFQSGFRNLSNFNRCFQKAYQCSPRVYRQTY